MPKEPKIKKNEITDALPKMYSNNEIDNALGDLLRRGELEPAGIKDGDDAFRLTPKGVEFAENLIATDPHQFKGIYLSFFGHWLF